MNIGADITDTTASRMTKLQVSRGLRSAGRRAGDALQRPAIISRQATIPSKARVSWSQWQQRKLRV